MDDSEKTRAELIDELEALRRRVAELEAAEPRRQQTEEALQESYAEQVRDLGWLSETTQHLLTLSDVDEILDYAGRVLQDKFEDCLTCTLTMSPDERTLRLETILGLEDSLLGQALELLGFDPRGRTFTITPEFKNIYRQGGLFRHQGGLAEFAASVLPLLAGKALASLLGSHEIYTVGLVGRQRVLGNLHIIARRPNLIEKPALVESFAYQVALALEQASAHKALRQSKARLQRIFDAAPVGIGMIVGRELQFANAKNCRMLGYAADELVGQPARILYPDEQEYRRVGETKLSRLMEEGGDSIETRFQHKNGGVLDILLSAALIDPTNPAEGIISMAVDITDRKRAEEALREYKSFLDATGRMARVGGWELDVETLEVRWTEETYRIHELPLSHKPSLQEAINFFHPADRERLSQAIQRALEKGEPYDLEIRFITAQGRHLWTHTICHPQTQDGKTVKLVGTFQDITKRKRTEEALRASEEKYRLLVESLNEGIWYVDREAYTTFVNPRMAEMLGYTVAEMQGKHLFEFMDEQGREIASQNLARRQQGIGEQHDFEFIRKDGRRIYTSLETTPILADDGQYLGALAGVQDITARRRAEVALRQYADRLQILHDIDAAILAAQSPPAIARAALERLYDLIPYRYASVGQIDLPRQRCRELVILTPEGPMEIPALPWQPLYKLGTLVATVQQGRTHLVQDIAALETVSPLEQSLAASGVRAYASVPMVVQEELLGTLNLAVDCPDFFRPDHVEILEEIAASLAIALQQARLLEQTQGDAEAKAMLLREVNHRVMNNLTMILYILDMEQQRGLEDQAGFQAALQDVATRIQGIATVHRMLSQAQQDSLDLGQVVTQIIQAAVSGSPIQDRLRVRVDGPEATLNLSSKQAVTVALIINELTTNSVKYAFRDRSQGQIQVQITALDGHQVRLLFRDDGPGLPAEVLTGERRNVGLWLVEASVAHTLRGEIEFWNEAGAVAAFTFEPAPVD